MNADAKKHTAAFGWFGIFAVAVFACIWLACTVMDTSWVWGTSTISDFGISKTDAASYFKYGCVLTGALLAVFGVGEACNKSKFGFVLAGVMFVLAGICLALLGVFTLDHGNGNVHHAFAYLFMIFMLAAIIAASANYWYDGHEIIGGISIALFCVAAAAAFAYPFAHFEVIAAVIGLTWTTMHSALTVASGIKGKDFQ